MAAGIQVPELERSSAPAPESVGRVDARAPDVGNSINQIGETVAKTGNVVSAYLDKVERDAAHTKSLEFTQAFEQDFNERLYGNNDKPGVIHYQGEPTEAYKSFDTDTQNKLDDLNEKATTLSPIAQSYVTRALSEKYNQLYNKRVTAYGHQYANYDANINDAAVKNEKNNLVDASGYIHPGDEQSTSQFDQSVGKIRNLIIRNAMKWGGATPAGEDGGNATFVDDDGKLQKVQIGEATKLRIASELSGGIHNAIDNLVKQGGDSLPVAKAMMDKYGGMLDALNKKKVNEEYTKASEEQQAYKVADDAQHLADPTKRIQYIEDHIKDPKIRAHALEAYDAGQRRIENDQKRLSDNVYNNLGIMIEKRMESENPYNSIFELKQDPVFKRQIDNVKEVKHVEALMALVDKPKKSDPDAFDRLFTAMQDGELKTKPPADFRAMKVGLNHEDSKMADSMYRQAISETQGQEVSRANEIERIMIQRLEGEGLIRKNPQTHEYPRADKELMNSMRSRLRNQFNESGKWMKVSDMQGWVDDIVKQEKQKKMEDDQPGWFSKAYDSLYKKVTGHDPESSQPPPLAPPLPSPRRSGAPAPKAAPSAAPSATPAQSEAPAAKATPVPAAASNLNLLDSLSPAEMSSYYGKAQVALKRAPTQSELADFVQKEKNKPK